MIFFRNTFSNAFELLQGGVNIVLRLRMKSIPFPLLSHPGAALFILLPILFMVTGCGSKGSDESPISVKTEIYQDKTHSLVPEEIINQEFSLQTGRVRTNPNSTTWLRISLRNETNHFEPMSIGFKWISHISMYDITKGSPYKEHQSGFLCPRSQISADDGEDHFRIGIEAEESKTFLLRLADRTSLLSQFDFQIIGYDQFLSDQNSDNQIGFFFLGAYVILIIFLFTAFLINRIPRHFIWLLSFLVFLSLYSQSMKGALINYIFPESPVFGWSLNEMLYHFAFASAYLFAIDFFRIKQINRRTYQFLILLVAYVLIKAISSSLYIYLTLDSGGLLKVNMISLPIETFLPGVLVVRNWKQFSREQRNVLWAVFSIILFIIIRITFFLTEETYPLSRISLIADFSGVICGYIFSAGLAAESRLRLVQRNKALMEINRVQQGQKEKLELMVEQRTREVSIANESLVEKNEVLAHRNWMIRSLVSEIHHRVKNNFQLVTSLLEMQSRVVDDSVTVKMLDDIRARIRSMALLHQKLYEKEEEDEVAFSEYAESMVQDIERIFQRSHRVQVTIESPPLQLAIDIAVTMGLVLNELITNAYKYGFDKEQPCLQISLEPQGESQYKLSVWDNGKADHEEPNLSSTSGFGLHLVGRLAKQLSGKVSYSYEKGTTVSILFTDRNDHIKEI